MEKEEGSLTDFKRNARDPRDSKKGRLGTLAIPKGNDREARYSKKRMIRSIGISGEAKNPYGDLALFCRDS